MPIGEQAVQRPVRAVAPTNLTEEPLGPTFPHTPIAGPGRGHLLEYTRLAGLIAEPEIMPPLVASCNWLKQHTLKKQWQTERMEQLERQLSEANSTIARQQLTIEALRERVRLPPSM